MKKHIDNLANTLLGSPYNDLAKPEQKVINSIAETESIVENVNVLFHEQLTFGQRLADKISSFGGSWTFIIIFLSILVSWMAINSFYLISPKQAFDPFPYIFLNLMLSTIAALQAPVIMMSQNRNTAKDRLDITENYKVSLKTDLEIIRLHQKIDELTKIISQNTENNEMP
jgi:uncharacterized membrane protein